MTNDERQPRNIPQGDTPRTGVTHSRAGSTPLRSTPRRSTTRDDLLAISWRLEPRDYVIAHLLSEHRFLTTDQIAAVLFTSVRTCRNRLNVLRKIGFIDWFMPRHPQLGRLPVHWVPGQLSARYVALYQGKPPPSARAARDQRDAYPAAGTRIGHLIHDDGAHQFFIDLLVHQRRHPEARLQRWWSPTRFAERVTDATTRPDGHGVWVEDDEPVGFFLEHDTGTMSHPDRAAKLPGYRSLRNKGMAWPVLFWLPTAAIETNLRRHLAGRTGGVLVATASRANAADHGGPAGPVWHVIGNGRRRLRLAELPGPVGTGDDAGDAAAAKRPGPPTPDEDPLYLLHADAHPAA
jgi:Replication-relaxation